MKMTLLGIKSTFSSRKGKQKELPVGAEKNYPEGARKVYDSAELLFLCFCYICLIFMLEAMKVVLVGE